MTKLFIKSSWNITQGKLKQKWAKLTNDELLYAEGEYDEMRGGIQKRTSENRAMAGKASGESTTA